ncbi:hypothetical protein ES319_D04G025100v1 [Gossypium barbadense]|uniref:Uncharacterized protein n=1 Tax=Gossypium barbadense TaxID=3634 RepID=A0A5J5RR59_GOSBA|nr:hypothetical protein ES319_D04G025100v1 [Gossypium barbadense]
MEGLLQAGSSYFYYKLYICRTRVLFWAVCWTS